MSEVRLDRVFTFGNQLSFLIPHEWIEADEEADHYLYHAPNADSGWFRVSLLTLRSGNASREHLYKLQAERADKERGHLYDCADNIVVAWEQISKENGMPICSCWWAVGHSHGPNLGYEALFSYTILHERRDDPETQETVALLAKLVADARFTETKVI